MLIIQTLAKIGVLGHNFLKMHICNKFQCAIVSEVCYFCTATYLLYAISACKGKQAANSFKSSATNAVLHAFFLCLCLFFQSEVIFFCCDSHHCYLFTLQYYQGVVV